MPDFDTVGHSVSGAQSADKAAGRALYVDDIVRPGMLHVALVLSPYAHARITRIDTTVAAAGPGVRCVLTGADFPRRFGAFVHDEVVLATGRVRYAGEPVVAIAADCLAQARHAASLVEVDYEELPAVTTIEQALEPGAPRVHEEFERYERRSSVVLDPNLCAEIALAEGDDIDAALARCDVVVEGEFRTQAQVHAYLEPCGAVAELEPGGKLAVWSACQSVFRVQATLSEILGLPMSRIRAIATLVGGSFGGKADVTVQPIAALMAMRTRRPVKVVLTRDDEFSMMRTRHPARIRMRTGALRDGTLVARSVDLVYDGGAYAEDSSAVLGFALLMARGPYRIQHLYCHGRAVYTNRLRAAGFRGYGNPQVTFAGESQIDEVAHRLNFDPIELRLRNAVAAGDRWVGGQRIEAAGLRDCLLSLQSLTRERPLTAPPGRRRGIGVSAFAHICGILSTSAIVRLLEDGSITMNTGSVDLGQGADTVLAQICAESLKLPLSLVNVAQPDTDGSPYNWSTGGSRSTYMVGRAITAAAAEVRKQIFSHAAQMLECSASDLELRSGGKVGVVGVGDLELGFRAVSQRAHWVAGGPIIGSAAVMFEGGGFDPKRTVVTGNAIGKLGAFIFGAQAVEVEVDESTGTVRVVKVWSAHDVGRAVNPAAIRGQIIGGVAQGIGYALYEELVQDQGYSMNPTLVDYFVPGALDVPEIEPLVVEHPEPDGPFGAKGVGEPPIIGVAPAIANAIRNATGARLSELPLTPERVLRALRS